MAVHSNPTRTRPATGPLPSDFSRLGRGEFWTLVHAAERRGYEIKVGHVGPGVYGPNGRWFAPNWSWALASLAYVLKA